jgi:hypothetical protein
MRQKIFWRAVSGYTRFRVAFPALAWIGQPLSFCLVHLAQGHLSTSDVLQRLPWISHVLILEPGREMLWTSQLTIPPALLQKLASVGQIPVSVVLFYGVSWILQLYSTLVILRRMSWIDPKPIPAVLQKVSWISQLPVPVISLQSLPQISQLPSSVDVPRAVSWISSVGQMPISALFFQIASCTWQILISVLFFQALSWMLRQVILIIVSVVMTFRKLSWVLGSIISFLQSLMSDIPEKRSEEPPKSQQQLFYQLIGECYVHKMMNGEAIDYQKVQKLPRELFEIR